MLQPNTEQNTRNRWLSFAEGAETGAQMQKQQTKQRKENKRGFSATFVLNKSRLWPWEKGLSYFSVPLLTPPAERGRYGPDRGFE